MRQASTVENADDRIEIDALLAEFEAAKQLSQTERNRGCARITERLAQLPPGEYLRDRLIGLLDSEPVMAFERRDLVYGAVWPDDWRPAVQGAVAKAFARPEDYFAYLRDLATEHRDADHRGEALQILARRYASSPEAFAVLTEIIDNYRKSRWIPEQLRDAESGIIEHFAQLPEALPYLIDSARDPYSNWSRNAAAMKALAEHHRDDPQTRPLLEDIARQPRRTSDDQAAGSALEVLTKYYPLDACLCDLLAEVIDIHEHPTEQRLMMTKLAKARYPRLKEILFKQARHAAHRGTKALAIKLLTQRFPDETDVPALVEDEPAIPGLLKSPIPDKQATLALLMKSARKNDTANHRVRAAAFTALAKHFACDDDVQRFFRDHGLLNPESELRQAIDRMVGKHFTFGEGIMEVLTDRLVNDPEEAVRREAAKVLAALSEPDNGRKPQIMRAMIFLHLSAEKSHLAKAFDHGDLEERIRVIVGYGPLHRGPKPSFVGPDEARFLAKSEKILLKRWPRSLCTKRQFRTEQVLQAYICAMGYIRFWFTDEHSEDERQEARKAIREGDPFEAKPPAVLYMARHAAWIGYWLAERGLEREQMEHGIRIVAEAIFARKEAIDETVDYILRGARHYRDWTRRESLETISNPQQPPGR